MLNSNVFAKLKHDHSDQDYIIDSSGLLVIDFQGHYEINELNCKLELLVEANFLFKKYSKFPFPKTVDGRHVTTEIRFNFAGKKTYRAIVWDKEVTGIFNSPTIYTIWESDDLWTLREIFQYQEPKHNPKSLCY